MKLKTYNTFDDLLTESLVQEDSNLNFDKTIGIFPGAFKPPHRGHYLTAASACERCDTVFILMSPTPREIGKASSGGSGPEYLKFAGLLPGGRFADALMENLHIELAPVDRETSASAMRAKIADYGIDQGDNITFLKNIEEFLPDMEEDKLLAVSDILMSTIKDGKITSTESEPIWRHYIEHLESKHKAVIEFDTTVGSPVKHTYDLCEALDKEAKATGQIYNVLLYTGE